MGGTGGGTRGLGTGLGLGNGGGAVIASLIVGSWKSVVGSLIPRDVLYF